MGNVYDIDGIGVYRNINQLRANITIIADTVITDLKTCFADSDQGDEDRASDFFSEYCSVRWQQVSKWRRKQDLSADAFYLVMLLYLLCDDEDILVALQRLATTGSIDQLNQIEDFFDNENLSEKLQEYRNVAGIEKIAEDKKQGIQFSDDGTVLLKYSSDIPDTVYEIPHGIVVIKSEAFKDCTNLTSVIIPNSVTEIEEAAFAGCTSLISVVMSNRLTEIARQTFKDCTSLTSVNIPGSVKEIKGWAFAGCTSLTSVDIPNSVTKIKKCAFENCSSLTDVVLPNHGIDIENNAFEGCRNLREECRQKIKMAGYDGDF